VRASVIIPTRNRTNYLREAVASVLAQNWRDFELIIVNDGDEDIPGFGDARIRSINSGSKGAVPARNLGVGEARGDIIAWLDDDDTWISPDHLASATEKLHEHDVLYFADGQMTFPNEKSPRHFEQDATIASLAANNTILISTVCYRRALHNELGVFDETLPYYWDWDWYLRVARSGRPPWRNTVPAADIRIHPNNMSGDSNRPERQKNLDLLTQKHSLGKIMLKNHTDFV
jgi:glycosyltransferase involved in cell wall biosynthesis